MGNEFLQIVMKQTLRFHFIWMILYGFFFNACNSNNDETNLTLDITGTYCLDFSLIDSELVISNSTISNQYSIQFNDFDGGSNSGTGTGSFSDNMLTINGTFTIASGVGNFTGTLHYDEASKTFDGSFSIVDPQNNPLITSTLIAKKGSCNYTLSPDQLHQVIGQPYLTSLHVELEKIKKISRYRSAAGHNFVDYSGESCVNLKHYFHTYKEGMINGGTVLPTSLTYYAPADGTIVNITQARASEDPTDYEVDIRLIANENIIVRIFHITPKNGISVGDTVSSGEEIATAPTAHLDSGDFAVYVLTNEGYRHLSMFEIMSPSVLQAYIDKGISTNWKQDLYYETDDPYVSDIFCENGTWGNLRHPLSNFELDFYIFN